MSDRLNPDGVALHIGVVTLYTPGLAGEADVHYGGTPGMRAAEHTTEDFARALERCGFQEQLTVEISDAAELETVAGGRTSTAGPVIELEVPGPGTGLGQVMLYTAEDGSLSWHFPDTVPRDASAIHERGGDRRSYRVPRHVAHSSAASGQRGIASAVGRKLLKLIVFPLVDDAIGAVASHFTRRWEQRYRPHALRTFTTGDYTTPHGAVLNAADFQRLASGRALLFVHGTMSRAHVAFGRIPPALFRELEQRYDGRVFAFDHPTVSVSPTDNARWLAQQLPDAGRLDIDVVAHSRGGLVARVLAERAADIGLDDRLALGTLVMVATPNAGTVLARPARIGLMIDRFTNVLQFLPDNGVSDVLEVILTVVKQLAVGVIEGLDGIMAMNPDGPYLREFLNRPGVTTKRYRAVAADFEPPAGTPLRNIARDGITDIVFGNEPNDLVVPTAGVYSIAGTNTFTIADPLVFEAAAGVDHSSFWDRAPFAEALKEWLGEPTSGEPRSGEPRSGEPEQRRT